MLEQQKSRAVNAATNERSRRQTDDVFNYGFIARLSQLANFADGRAELDANHTRRPRHKRIRHALTVRIAQLIGGDL